MARSLRIDTGYIKRAKLALQRSGISSQRSLAKDLNLALSTISRFFTGKPVDHAIFVDICDHLGLDWRECAAVDFPPPMPAATPEVNPAHTATMFDWGSAADATGFLGRDIELATLKQWIVNDRCHLVIVLGMGGMGKTVLSIKLAQQLTDRFTHVIWRSLRNAPPILDLLSDLIGVLSRQQDREIPATVDQGIARLLVYLRQSRCLLVLDNGEALLQSGDRTGRYCPGYEGYGQLLRAAGESEHSSCLVMTTREQPRSFTAKQGEGLPIRSLKLAGLSVNDGQRLISTKGSFIGSKAAWIDLVDHYAGNPLALMIVSGFLSEFFESDLHKFLDFIKQSPFIFDDIQDLLNQQIQRLSSLQLTTMYWLAINREPISLPDLQADFLTPISTGELLQVLASLQNRCLVERNRLGFTQQPVVMEYMTSDLIRKVSDELFNRQPNLFRCHALIKTQALDYVRDIQIRLILQPVVDELKARWGSTAHIETHLSDLIATLRGRSPQETGYVAGNTINLLRHLDVDLCNYDFSQLTVWQADLQNLTLNNVNFAGSDLSRSRFTQTFGGILAVAVSPDGSHLLTGDTNGELLLWQLTNRQHLSTFTGHTNVIWSIAFSPDGTCFASGSFDRTIRLWNIADGACTRVLRGHTDVVWSVAFSSDGAHIASGSSDGTLRLWSVTDGQCLKTFENNCGPVRSVAFSPDSAIIASGGVSQTVKLWDMHTGRCLQTLIGHSGTIQSVTFSTDGSSLASSSDDQTIKIWDLENNRCRLTLADSGSAIWACIFSPDNQILAGGSQNGKLWVWDVQSGRCLYQLIGHTNIVHDVVFSPDEETIVTGSVDGTVKLWRRQDGRCLTTLSGHTNTIWSLAYNPEGNIIVSGSQDGIARFWNLEEESFLREFKHQEALLSVAVSFDGRLLATGSSHIEAPLKLWTLDEGQLERNLPIAGSVIRSVAFSPNSQLLVSAGDDHIARLWDVNNEICIHILQEHTNAVWETVFSPDGTLVATASFDYSARLWTVNDGQCLHRLEGHQGDTIAVAFSSQGEVIASSGIELCIRLWSVEDGQCYLTLTGHTNFVPVLAAIPKSPLLASGSLDQTIRIWDVRSGECVNVLQGHTKGIWTIAASPDGRTLASGGDDETIRLWDVNTGECLKTLTLPKPYEGMNIDGIHGITTAQATMLKALGAIE